VNLVPGRGWSCLNGSDESSARDSARFDARKLVLVPPPLVCAKDEMSMVLFLFPLKATGT
jgi:hypothetical protein